MNLLKSLHPTGLACLGLLAFTIVSPQIWAVDEATMTGREAMELSNHRTYYSGGDRTTSGRVVVEDKNGTIRSRATRTIRLDDQLGGEQSYLVYFEEPTDLERTTFLVNKKPGLDDERWLYLPELDMVRRIEAGDKRTHFVGTDLFYEDVSGRHLDSDKHTLLEDEKKYWIVRSEPIKKGEAEFAWYKTWVHKKTHLPIRVEYYDTNEKLYRRTSVKKVRMVSKIPTPTKIVIEDFNTGSTTTQTCLAVEFSRGLEKELFVEQSLRKPPMKWLTIENNL